MSEGGLDVSDRESKLSTERFGCVFELGFLAFECGG